VSVAVKAQRQLELEDVLVDQLRNRHGQQSDLAFVGMVGQGRAGELRGDLGESVSRRSGAAE
jgi:hypothetical protein